jgi:hypothetical protein
VSFLDRVTWRRPAPELTERERKQLTSGLAGFCAHGVGVLDNCPDCCPPKSVAELHADRVEAVELAGRLLRERDAARCRWDEAMDELTKASLVAERLQKQVFQMEGQLQALRARTSSQEASDWRRRSDEDRRSCQVMADALALSEGRPLMSSFDEKAVGEVLAAVRAAVAGVLGVDVEVPR